MNCEAVAYGWFCELKSGRGKNKKGDITHGSNFNETTS
ncbi:ribosomal protein S2 [Streptococcus anginosus]|nr:ribosomal protein S2 [Streptococcus anginosus]